MSKQWFESAFGGVSNISQSAPKRSLQSETTLKKNKSTKATVKCDDEVMCIDDDDDKLKSFQSIDWVKKFQPQQVADLVIHPKKLDELKNWFKLSCVKVPNKILLIEGPTGAGKTTALKLIAKESGYDVSEWINSTDMERDLFYENSENFQSDFISYESQVAKFSDFLLRTSRFQSIFSDNKRLLLVKDFPNTFLKKTEEFWSILRKYVSDGLSPLVFIVTETNSKSLNIAFNLFPDKLRSELIIDTITFNPVSATMMKRGIKRIVQMVESNSKYKPYFKRPTDEVIDSLIEQCQGDIRNAVLNLNFASQQSDFKFQVPKAVKPKKGEKKKKTMKRNDDGGLGKNEVLSMMHGLGRVFHPKLEINTVTKRSELTHKPEDITEAFSSQPSNFIKMVHSNYIKNFTDISDVAEAASIFSLSDCFESEYRDDRLNNLNLNLIIRSAMVLNRNPAGGFRSVSAHANKKYKKQDETNRELFNAESKKLNNGNIMAHNDFFCDYNSFTKIIKS